MPEESPTDSASNDPAQRCWGPLEPAPGLVAQLYDELRMMARRYVGRERVGNTLQTTALVHEVFLRLGPGSPQPADAAATGGAGSSTHHFFAAAALAMRRILVDRARARKRIKRGGGAQRVSLEEAEQGRVESEFDWEALDQALKKLEKHDPELAHLVSLRYFAGLSVDQAANAMGVSPRTVDRNWRVARAYLQRSLMDSGENEGES